MLLFKITNFSRGVKSFFFRISKRVPRFYYARGYHRIEEFWEIKTYIGLFCYEKLRKISIQDYACKSRQNLNEFVQFRIYSKASNEGEELFLSEKEEIERQNNEKEEYFTVVNKKEGNIHNA